MKLTTRRTVRQWFLDTPRGTVYAFYAAAIGLTALGISADTDSVVLAGVVAGAGLYAVREIVQFDACPTCNSKVAATSERFCSTCGARLDALEAAPPIDDRVDERFRPVGLEELERREPPEREPNPVADGGEREEHKEDR